LEIDQSNTDYLIEGGYQALMSQRFNDAIKFYKTAAKTQADNMSAVYGENISIRQSNLIEEFSRYYSLSNT
jgi:hypothetical protein